MYRIVNKQIGDLILSLEVGKVGKQADGAVLVRYGDSTVFATVCVEKKSDTEKDFLLFPFCFIFVRRPEAVIPAFASPGIACPPDSVPTALVEMYYGQFHCAIPPCLSIAAESNQSTDFRTGVCFSSWIRA